MRVCTVTQLAMGSVLIGLWAFSGCSASTLPSNEPATPKSPPPATTDEPSAAVDEPLDEPGGDEPAGAGGGESGSGDDDSRTTESIQAVIKNNRDPFRKCYEAGRKELPTLEGMMTIKFELDPEGKVKKAELNVERSDIKAPTVVDCSIKELKKLKFPPSSKGMETTVNYPFNFKP